MKTPLLTAIATAGLLAACNSETGTQKIEISQTVQIEPLKNNAGEEIGTITVSGSEDGGVRLVVKAENISPGAHGMHFHEKGDCSSADFKSAGGHINPMGVKHGLKNPDGPDNADMENLVADENGKVNLERLNARLSMTGSAGLPALLDEDGSALVIHANPDDQMTQPIGGAGARIACAEIRK